MKKGLLALFAVLVPLALAEVILRFTDIGLMLPQMQFGTFVSARLEDGGLVVDPDLGWRQKPGPYPARESQLRFVHLDDPRPAPTGKTRILCLGDSCTRLAPAGKPYPAWLEESLGPDRVEVYNASMVGYTSHQGLVWLRKQLLEYRPDVLVVYFGWNDHWRVTGREDKEYAAILGARLKLTRLFDRPPSTPPLRVALDDFRANLLEMARLMQEAGGHTLFLTGPSAVADRQTPLLNSRYIRPGDDADALHREYAAAVRALEGQHGARVLDTMALFERLDEVSLTMMDDGIHLTDVGHELLADALHAHLAQTQFDESPQLEDAVLRTAAHLADVLARRGRWDEAAQRYRAVIDQVPEVTAPRLGLAWLLAASPVPYLRDAEAALAIVDQLPGEGPAQLDIRAAALAEQGEYRRAVALMDQVLATSADHQEARRARRDLYAQSRVYRLTRPR